MFDFFPKIVKNKKIFIFIFLFLVIFGLTIPKISAAGFFDWLFSSNCPDPSTATTQAERDVIMACLRGEQKNLEKIDSSLGRVENGIKSLGDVIAIPFAATALALGMFLIVVFASISALSATFLAWMIKITDNAGCYTCMENTVIATGWPMIRDLANMFVVLGFVVIGIATILRFREYEAKKLLPKLIIAALLINFSLLICGIFIDGSNIMAKHFLKSGGFFSTSWMQMTGSQIDSVWAVWKGGADYTGSAMGVLKVAGGLLFYNIMALIIFFLYAFLYLFRLLALWILVVLSPLAFVCSVFPFTKNIWDMWWKNFFQWCIIIIPISFFVWIADTITEGMKNAGKESPVAYMIPGAFMLIGFLYALQSSAMGAGAAMGVAKWSGGKLMGAGAGGALRAGRLADRATGGKFSEWSDKSKQKIARISETLGGKTGSAAQTQQARNTDAEKTVDALLSAPAGSKDRLRGEQLVKTGRGALGAAAVKKANEMGELSDLLGNDMNKIDQRSTFAGQFGHAKKQFEDKNPFLAGMDPQKIEKELVAMGLPNTAPGRARAKSSLIRKSVEKNWNNMSTSERANIDISDWHADDRREFIFGSNGSSFIDAQRSLSTNPLTPGGALREKNTDVLLGAYDPNLYGPGIGGRVGGIFGNNPNTLNNAHEGDAELNRRASRGDTTGERELKNRRSKAHSLV